MWRTMLPETAPTEGSIDFSALAAHKLTGALIRQAALRAATLAASGEGTITQRMLVDAAERAGGLERKRKAVGFG